MKKILSILLVAFMAIGVNAGNGNKTMTGGPYKVGDYYNDGAKEGIVFVVYDGGYHGKIVSLDESRGQWAVDAVDENVTGATSKGGGMSNMNKIKKQPNWETNYPAFAWCASLGDGWYLPAINELKLIWENIDVINRKLNERGYSEIEHPCWASTENSEDHKCAYVISMMGDTDDSCLKINYLFYVRAVSAF